MRGRRFAARAAALVLAYTLMVGDPKALLTAGLVPSLSSTMNRGSGHGDNEEEGGDGDGDEALFSRDARLCFDKRQRASMSCHLDWMRRFGLGVWFGGGSSSSSSSSAGVGGGARGRPSVVSAGLAEYTAAARAGVAAPPLPLYRARRWHADEGVAMALLKDKRQRAAATALPLQASAAAAAMAGRGGLPPAPQHCVLYHLLECFCLLGDDESSEQCLLSALHPEAVTADKLDFRHSFQLLTLLDALGLYARLPKEVKARVLDGCAQQLEVGGRWEWACYVHLFHDDARVRLRNCRELLLRHAHESPQGFTLPGSQQRVGRAAFLCGGSGGGGGSGGSGAFQFGLGLPRALLDEALCYWSNYGALTGYVNIQPGLECGVAVAEEGLTAGPAERRAGMLSSALAATSLVGANNNNNNNNGSDSVDLAEEDAEALHAEVHALALRFACGVGRKSLRVGGEDNGEEEEAWGRSAEDTLLLSWLPRFAALGNSTALVVGKSAPSSRLFGFSSGGGGALSTISEQRRFLDAALGSLTANPSSSQMLTPPTPFMIPQPSAAAGAVVAGAGALPSFNPLLRAYGQYLDVRLSLEHHAALTASDLGSEQQEQERRRLEQQHHGLAVLPLAAVPALVQELVRSLAKGRYGGEVSAGQVEGSSSGRGVQGLYLSGDTYGAGSYAGGVGAQEVLECQRVEMLQFCAEFEQRQQGAKVAAAVATVVAAKAAAAGGAGQDGGVVAARSAMNALQARALGEAAIPLGDSARHAGLQVALRAFVQAL
eukprot:CAMPEP_0171926754 /NCGR_PEP_ID=MMETSP0993-20121228/25151_1 /TAXON_ID=483369 /ORGANISM="non described non described, Strain CCMP2098" /LENGTH=771 /DNA_ID=CAMNT_0012565641 /DNA_START=22 /DNA_END=2338 /DNA_ORIENTATION=-